MAASIKTLCDGVVTALNGAEAGTFSETFVAEFQYAPSFSNMMASTLRVLVTDAGGDVGLISRAWVGMTDSVRVVIMWRVDETAGTGIDEDLMARALQLLEEITVYLIGRSVGGYSQLGTAQRGTGEKDKEHYMPGNLEDRCFAASLLLPYQTKLSTRTEAGS
jgi:hypothetical protein